MYLQIILSIGFLFTLLAESFADRNPDLLISRTGVDTITPCGIGLKFYVELNNTSETNDFEVQLSADQCCLEADDSLDCDVLEILGDCVGVVPRGTIRTVRMVAPLLDPLERHGHCIVYLDSKSNDDGRNMRDTVKINFDTRIKNIKETFDNNVKQCKVIDEDPFNDCKPVNCDTYYNGRKPHYSRKIKRCVQTPPCISEVELDIPNIIYDPVLNRCIEGESINKRDIDYVKELDSKDRKVKDVLIIKKFNDDVDNSTNFDLNDAIDRVPMCKECKKLHILEPARVTHVRKECYNNIYSLLTTSRYTLAICGGVILIQCCMIIALTYCFTKTCACCKEKKVVRKFFNYRQDASVTTPLIGTSNMDTETTDYEFQGESNGDQKIKCYKACQKERNNVKLSMSDDILAKCVNRRNWSRCLTKSEAIPEAKNETKVIEDEVKLQSINETKISATKVVFEDEKPRLEKQSKQVGSIHINNDIIERERNDIEQFDSSEREIQCHSYNFDDNSNITGFQPSVSKNLGYFQTEKSKKASISTEKGAQAYFSNDSIDDLLSERGIYFTENISKFTLSSDSSQAKLSTPGLSSKTSKNFVKNILTLLHKKSKTTSSSDPGPNGKETLDVKLIHMSRASLHSSTNNSECPKCKPPQDSRTSL